MYIKDTLCWPSELATLEGPQPVKYIAYCIVRQILHLLKWLTAACAGRQPRGPPRDPQGPIAAELEWKQAPHWPHGPFGAGLVWKQAAHGPQGPQGGYFYNPGCSRCDVPRRGVCFIQNYIFLHFWVNKNVKNTLRLRGRATPGEIRAEILHITAPRMGKTVGWRPDW